MANHKSSKKRIRQTAAKRAHNRLFHKTARNAVKALRANKTFFPLSFHKVRNYTSSIKQCVFLFSSGKTGT